MYFKFSKLQSFNFHNFKLSKRQSHVRCSHVPQFHFRNFKRQNIELVIITTFQNSTICNYKAPNFQNLRILKSRITALHSSWNAHLQTQDLRFSNFPQYDSFGKLFGNPLFLFEGESNS